MGTSVLTTAHGISFTRVMVGAFSTKRRLLDCHLWTLTFVSSISATLIRIHFLEFLGIKSMGANGQMGSNHSLS